MVIKIKTTSSSDFLNTLKNTDNTEKYIAKLLQEKTFETKLKEINITFI